MDFLDIVYRVYYFYFLQEEIAKDLLSGDYEEETQSSADDLTPSVTSHETTDFFPRTLRCKWTLVVTCV